MLTLLATVTVVQEVLFNNMSLAGLHPDVVLVTAVAASFALGEQLGAEVGFLAGLAADLFTTGPFGLSPIVYLLVGYAAGRTNRVAGDRLAPAVFAAMTSLWCMGATGGYALLSAILGTPAFGPARMAALLATEGVWALLLAVPLRRAVRWTARSESRR